MAHIYNSGYAVVDTDPNNISALQSGHKIRLALFENGNKAWRFVESNSAGSKWIETPLTSGGSETITSLSKLDNSNRLTYNDENEQTVNIVIEPVIKVTAQEFLTLRQGQALVAGQEYEITDFKPVYTQLESNVVSDSVQGITDGLNVNARFNPIIKAKTGNIIETRSRTTMDGIFIEFTPNVINLNLKIIKTIDTIRNVEVDYDLFHEQFRLYKVNVPDYNSSSPYNLGDIIKFDDTGTIRYYTRIRDSFLNNNTLDGAETITNKRLWLEISAFGADTRVNQDFTYKNLSADLTDYDNYYGIRSYQPNFSITSVINVRLNRGVVINSSIVKNVSISTKSDNNLNNGIQTVMINGGVHNSFLMLDKNSVLAGDIINVTANITNCYINGITGKSSDTTFGLSVLNDRTNIRITDSFLRNAGIGDISILRSVIDRVRLHTLNDGEYRSGISQGNSILYSALISPTYNGFPSGQLDIYFGQVINRTKLMGYQINKLIIPEGMDNCYFYLDDTRLNNNQYVRISKVSFDSSLRGVYFQIDPSFSTTGNIFINPYSFKINPVDSKNMIFKAHNTSVQIINRYHSPTGTSTTRSDLILFRETTSSTGIVVNTAI
ncbi:hypothetical protein [Tenacibaculum halocynthiae]|uniref:hypothetical protein n=1 Tax=Tenacibaculum halocynthiae TaxID=1254437 RepID=UPI003D64EA89